MYNAKRFILVNLFSFLVFSAFSQQGIIWTYPSTIINENDIFFNKQIINPSTINDTFKVQTDFIAHQQWLGYENSPNYLEFLFNGHLNFLNSYMGVISKSSTYGPIKDQRLKFNITSAFSFNEKSKIRFGINFGLSRFKIFTDQLELTNISDPYYAINIDWKYNPNLDLGLTYSFLNQNIGISCLDCLTSKLYFGNLSTTLAQRTYTFNYFSTIKINSFINLLPEIYVLKYSAEHDYAINCTVQFKNILKTGLLYDYRNKSCGIMVSGLLFKYFDLGYIFDMMLSPIQSKAFGIS